MPVRQIELQSDGLRLEGRFYEPAGGADVVCVVCHPHPQYGGDMDNNVVVAIARALESIGIGALCFNFRGVGHSEGAYDDGNGEQDDVRAAIAHARSLAADGRVCLAGYSFGAGMAAAVVDENVEALCLLSIPDRSLAGAAGLPFYRGPVLLIAGSADHAANAEALLACAEEVPEMRQAHIVAGADHFWRGYEDQLAAAVKAFFREALAN